MSTKTDTEVIIGGKVFTLSGYESEEYLQKVASYINNKINEYGKIDYFRKLPMDTQNVLLQLNIADDYFKARQRIALLEEEIKDKDTEIYDLKHDLINAQMKRENSERNVKNFQKSKDETKDRDPYANDSKQNPSNNAAKHESHDNSENNVKNLKNFQK